MSLIKKYETEKIIFASEQFPNYKNNLKKLNLLDNNMFHEI